jgi:hypothetical protein
MVVGAVVYQRSCREMFRMRSCLRKAFDCETSIVYNLAFKRVSL